MNKKYLIVIAIVIIGLLFIITPDKKKVVITDEELKEMENKTVSCIETKLNKYINNGKEILLSDITDKKDKIEYFKAFHILCLKNIMVRMNMKL